LSGLEQAGRKVASGVPRPVLRARLRGPDWKHEGKLKIKGENMSTGVW
jgi:hypothetical protein